MKLLLRRDQRAGMLGKVLFALEVRADLTPDEQANVAKYKLGETMLYQRFAEIAPGHVSDGYLGPTVTTFLTHVARDAMNVEIKVADLAGGRRFEFKDIREMLAAQAAITQAAKVFKAVLDACATFGGEEVVEI
jgi:hypothetical protein